jgi:hypothetical protein
MVNTVLLLFGKDMFDQAKLFRGMYNKGWSEKRYVHCHSYDISIRLHSGRSLERLD